MKKTTLFPLLTMLLLFVGNNVWADTYTHTFVTTDIPQDTQNTEFTLSGVDWTLTMDGGKVSVFSNDLGAHFGTNTATCNSVGLSTEDIPGTITSITVEASRGKNLVGTMAVTVNETNFTLASGSTTTALAQENIAYEFTGSASGEIAIVWTKSSGQGAFYIKKITIEYNDGSGVTVTKPVITPAGGTFSEPQEVTITAGEGCTVFYTTDGTTPTDASTQYTVPFTVSEDCIVKAIAYDEDDNASSIASAVFTFPTTITSIADLCAAATSTSTPVTVQFNNWVCTGVSVKNSSNVYFTDGQNGILLYQSGHGFELGDQLTGSAQINLTTYNECPEITGLKTTTEGVTVTKGATVTPLTVTIGELQKNMQGDVIKLEGVTYNATDKVFKDDSGADIIPYDLFITLPGLTDGATYDVTGVAVWFKNKQKWEIAPRTADEFQEVDVLVAKPTITPAGGKFAEPQEVTITADEDCTIYYTLDGTDPSEESTQYTAPFTISESCTVKAIAYNEDDNASKIASAEFTFIAATAISTIAELCAAAPAEGETEVFVEFNNWIVTGVKGNQMFFTDGSNGIVAYKSGHGFEVGDVLTGSAVVTLTVFNECAEITSLTSTTTGVTVTKGTGATPINVAIAELTKDMQGCLLSYEGLTYNGSAFVDDAGNTITPNNKFIALPTLVEGKTYNVTGVAVWFVSSEASGYWAIAPRTAEEIVLVTSQLTPESSWGVEEESVDIHSEVTAVFTTNSDGAVTYTSSNEAVATVDGEGHITLIARGITTITANVAETETYLADSKSFKLTVTVEGYVDIFFAYNDEDIAGQGAPDTGAELTATRNDIVTLYANKAYAKPNDTHIKFYGSKYETTGEGEEAEKVLTEPSYIQLSVPEGYVITDIVLTATGESNIKEWQDQDGNAATISGATATWKGECNEVILTNLATAQARIKTIAVTYFIVDPDGIDEVRGQSMVNGQSIYNLAGQRLNKMQKGINIVGGKKIIK